MIVRRIRNDELTHYGVKGMKWRNHRRNQHSIPDDGAEISGDKRSHVHLSDKQKELIKKANESRRNVKSLNKTRTIADYKANEVKDKLSGKNDRIESMKNEVQRLVEEKLSTGKNAERRKLNSSRSNRVNTGKKQINDLKDKREKDKRNIMWNLQKSYNRSVKSDRKKKHK